MLRLLLRAAPARTNPPLRAERSLGGAMCCCSLCSYAWPAFALNTLQSRQWTWDGTESESEMCCIMLTVPGGV
jgi:hypothetical protein